MAATGRIEASSLPEHAGVSRLLLWHRTGWRLFRAAPLAGLALALAPIVVEAALQAIPLAGMLSSKLLTPLVSAWVLCVLHQRTTGGAFQLREASRRWKTRLPAVLCVALLSLMVFGFQILVLGLSAGFDQVRALVLLDTGALSLTRPQLALIFAAGVLPTLPLAFMPAQAVLAGRGVVESIGDSVAAVSRCRAPMLALAALSAGAMAAVPWQPWLLLAILPWGLYIGYASWADVFGGVRQERGV